MNEFTVINIDTFIPVIFFYIEVIPRSAFDRIVSLRKLILLFIFKFIWKNQFRSLYNHINFNWHIFTPNTHMTSFVFKCEGQIAIDSRLSLKTYTLYMFWGLYGFVGWVGVITRRKQIMSLILCRSLRYFSCMIPFSIEL